MEQKQFFLEECLKTTNFPHYEEYKCVIVDEKKYTT